MDDISFFESTLYEHRGGIWSDAARKTFLPKGAVPTPDDVQSVASAPLPDIGVSGFPTECIAPVVSKSMDDVNVAATLHSTTTTADKPPLPVPPVLEESPDSSHIPDSSRSSARRRTWFSSMPADDSSLPLLSNLVVDANQPEALETRGRPVENVESLRLSRSTSYSSKSGSARAVTPDRSEDEHKPSQSATHLIPHSSRRSSSQHSVNLEQGSSHQEGPLSPQARSTPNTPSRNSDTSQIGRSPSPPSFFSTLKSRAADKQVISNTAKEAMRKWGVNWTGFIKKDAVSDESFKTGSPPSLGSPLEDNLTHKTRASYAEVRAAVAERKERERTAHIDDSSDTLRPSSPSASALSNSTPANESAYSDAPINPSTATSAAHLSAPRLSSKRSVSSMSRESEAQELPDTEEPIKSPPIHVQPQAKTMSIPGIHASHRGEVQSMGYVAPQVQQTPTSPSENVLKKPAIQSVYRLWKTPSGSPSSSVGPEAETRVLSGDSLAGVTAPPQQHVKSTPPPLPPRSSSLAISRTGGDTSADVVASLSSSASQALKTIVLKDERIRRTSTEVALTPPLLEPTVQGSSNPVPTADIGDISISLETTPNIQTVSVSQGNSAPPLPPRRNTSTSV
jgi:hypothetical protein